MQRRAMQFALVVTALMFALSVLGWAIVPDGAKVGVHFGLDGIANPFADKATGLLQLPMAAALATFLFWLTPKLQKPKRRDEQAPLLAAMTVGVSGLLGVGHALTVWSAIGDAGVGAAARGAYFLLLATAGFFVVVIFLLMRAGQDSSRQS